ncbi:hypothetical protein AN958_09024 [Leucoagaricus sp. SymC.cos]|nr:hypothetical protein AN958_09024 [Leucoagaricus sp. SymC.cos]
MGQWSANIRPSVVFLPSVIGADPADLDTLFDDEFEERVGRFATGSGGVVYAVKSRMMTRFYRHIFTTLRRAELR